MPNFALVEQNGVRTRSTYDLDLAKSAFGGNKATALAVSASTFSVSGMAQPTSPSGSTNPARTVSNATTSSQALMVSSSTSAVLRNQAGRYTAEKLAWRGNGPGKGGFIVNIRWSPDTSPTSTDFIGLCANGLPNATPEDNVNSIGIIKRMGDTNYQLFTCGATTAERSIFDLGTAFSARATGTIFTLCLFCDPNASTIGFSIRSLETGAAVSDTFVVNLPVNNVFMALAAVTGNTVLSAAVINIRSFECWTPY